MVKHESAKMPWKILNHPDKLYGKVTTRQMTEEERQKYGEANQNTKKRMGAEEYMKSLGISTEQLIEDCKKHGTGWVSAKVIAEKYDNITQKQIYGMIKNRKIKAILEAQNEVNEYTENTDCKTTQCKGHKEHNLRLPESKGIAINIADLKDYKPRLRPGTMISQSLNKLRYSLLDEELVIEKNGVARIKINWKDLDDFIADLQEVKEIAEE